MPTISDFHCWIEVDGVTMQEYSIENTDNLVKGPQATCWVASEAGKKFSLNWEDESAYGVRTTSGYIKLDGESVRGMLLKPDGGSKASISTNLIDAHTERSFSFATMETTDDDSYLARSISQSTGEINIEIWGVQIGYETVVIPAGFVGADSSSDKIHEKSKKAINHRIQLGAPTTTNATKTGVYVTKRSNTPLATFTFKYRDLLTLQANGIAPPPVRAATPIVVEPKKRPAPAADEEDEIEIIDRVAFKKEAEAKRRPFKDHNSSSNSHAESSGSSKRVKKETSKPMLDSEIIDLT